MASPTLAATLQSAIAAELRHVRGQLEKLAEILVGDEHFVEKYIDHLQAFDLLVQCADESALLLDRLSAGGCVHEAVTAVRLDVVQNRLRAALAQAA